MRCAVIGSTGYVGARLVSCLLHEGHQVSALVRTPTKLAATGWADAVDVVSGDLADDESLAVLLSGAEVVYHLAHALDRPDFPERDRLAAEAVRDAAVAAGTSRIVYLGGLRPTAGAATSRHLTSRAEVADVFLGCPVPTVSLEASIIVGSGSASFEMIRYFAERMPLVPAVPWVSNRTQPIAIGDVLHYLVAAASLPAEVDRRFDIGGPDVLTYLDIVRRYLRAAGLPRSAVVPLPLPVPPRGVTLAAWVIGALTPLSRHLVAALIESLANDLVCAENDVLSVVGAPPGGPTTYDRAVRAALGHRPDVADPPASTPVAIEVRGERVAGPAPATGWGGQGVRWSTRAPPPPSSERLWEAVCAISSGKRRPVVPWVGRWTDQLLGGAGARRGRPPGRDLDE